MLSPFNHSCLSGRRPGVDSDLEESDDEEEEVMPELKPSDPEYKWKVAKENHNVESASMDKLMELTGMREIKNAAVGVFLAVLTARSQPAHLKREMSMNFLFVGKFLSLP
jgi:hypothetical protein